MCTTGFRFFYHGAANLLSDRIAKLTDPSLEIDEELTNHYRDGISETSKQMSDYLDLASTASIIKFGSANTFDSVYETLNKEPLNKADNTEETDIKYIRAEYKALLESVQSWSVAENFDRPSFPLKEEDKLRLVNFLKKVVITEAALSNEYHGRN